MEWWVSWNLPGKMERQRWKRGNFKRHQGILKGTTDVNLWKAGRKHCTRRENKLQMGFTKEKTSRGQERWLCTWSRSCLQKAHKPYPKDAPNQYDSSEWKMNLCRLLFVPISFSDKARGSDVFKTPHKCACSSLRLHLLETPYLLCWLPNLSGLLGKMKFRLKKSRSALLMQ